MTVVEAAFAVFRLVNANMSNGIRTVSVQRGYDPADFMLVAFGGAAAIHAGVQADDLRIPLVLVPRAAPVLCAYGDLMADIKVSEVQTYTSALKEVSRDSLDDAFQRIAERARSRVPTSMLPDTRLEASVDLRYRGEVFELTVALPLEESRIPRDGLATLEERFHLMHEQRYAYRDVRSPIDLLNLRVDARVPISGVSGDAREPLAAATTVTERQVYFGDVGFVPTRIFQQTEVGAIIHGPAVIEEQWTTIVVQPNQQAVLDERGDYLLTRSGSSR